MTSFISQLAADFKFYLKIFFTMDTVHLHLLLNHVPIVGTFIGLMICITSFFIKDQWIRRIGLSVFVFAAACAIPVYLTGESAEEAIEHLPGVNESLINKHEDAA